MFFMKTPNMTPTPKPINKLINKPKKRVRFNLSHAQTNHITSELLRRKAEESRNNIPGNELIQVNKFNWSPNVN